MVRREAVPVFFGRDYGIFGCAPFPCIGNGGSVLYAVVSDDFGNCCENCYLGRSGVGMAFVGMHYLSGKWNSVILYRDCRAVSIKNISGNKAQADFYSERVQ